MPKYQFPEVYIFPENVYYCHASYIPSQRAVVSPNKTILFAIIVESMNEMLQLQLGENLTPISIRDLLDCFPKLTTKKLAEMFQYFIIEGKPIPKDPPPYVYTIFFKFGHDIVAMISSILGYTTNEYIDEIVLAFMSLFTPGQPPSIMYYYAKFIANRMPDHFLRMSNERVFKYSSILRHLFLYYKADKFPFTLQSLILKVILGE